MTPDQARALVEEGRKHDEAVHRKVPACTCAERGEPDWSGHEKECPVKLYGSSLVEAAAWREAHFGELLELAADGLRWRDTAQRDWQDRVWTKIYAVQGEQLRVAVARLRDKIIDLGDAGFYDDEVYDIEVELEALLNPTEK